MARRDRERDIMRDTYDEDDPYQISYTLGRNNEEAIKRQEEDIRQIKKSVLDNFKVLKCAIVTLGCLLVVIISLLLMIILNLNKSGHFLQYSCHICLN